MAIFECRDLTKRYGRTTALDHFSLTVEPGSILGLLGPNGSGKTTLLKLANGLLTPNGGEILIGGLKPGLETKNLVSYLPDKNYLPDWMNANDLMDLFGDFYQDFDRERAAAMLNSLGIDPKQAVGRMSKGTREKTQLIFVMSRRAKLYLLDEPIGGVDPATRDYILNTIISNYEPESAVVISTHLIADVEQVLDTVCFINNGRLVLSSTVDEIRGLHGKSVDAYFREVFKCSAN